MTAQDIRRMLELLAAIEARLAHIEAMLANAVEKPAFVEWAEPQQLHQPEQP